MVDQYTALLEYQAARDAYPALVAAVLPQPGRALSQAQRADLWGMALEGLDDVFGADA